MKSWTYLQHAWQVNSYTKYVHTMGETNTLQLCIILYRKYQQVKLVWWVHMGVKHACWSNGLWFGCSFWVCYIVFNGWQGAIQVIYSTFVSAYLTGATTWQAATQIKPLWSGFICKTTLPWLVKNEKAHNCYSHIIIVTSHYL